MGCDIHMNYEVLKDGKWEYHDFEESFRIGTYSDGSVKFDYDKMWKHPLYVDRGYNLFSILANVRNGYGFAGCSTSSGFNFISQPRGLPKDVSDEVRTKSDDWGCDGHSHSFLAVQEVLEFDWDQTVTLFGAVSPSEYKEFKENGAPSNWCGGASGSAVRNITNEEMDDLLGDLGDDLHYYTRVSWQRSYKEAVGSEWLATWFQTLQELQSQEGPVRLVFWFDN